MPEEAPISHNLFFFRLEDYEGVKNGLVLLIQNKEKLLALNDKVIEKMFEYINPMYSATQLYKSDNIFDLIDMSSCSFLSAALIKEFIKDPKNLVLRDRLSVQLALVGAATFNFLKPDLEPYNYEEIIRILVNGEKAMYTDFTFLYSLRSLLEINEPDDRVAAIFTTLDKINPEDSEFPLFYWNEALAFSLALQLIWKNFLFFDFKQQEFILTNYLFSAIVAGVPVDYWLKIILSTVAEGFDNQHTGKLFLKSIENNEENIPTNTVTFDNRKLREVLFEYVGQVYSGGIKTLVQEKFIQSIYGGQLEEKKFSFWLRNLLQLYYNLRSDEYLPK